MVRTELPANVPAALSAGWQSELRRIGVPGDPRVLDRYVADHRPALDELARTAAGMPRVGDGSALDGALVRELARRHPGATFDLMVMRDGTMRSGFAPGQTQVNPLVVRMVEGDRVRHFTADWHGLQRQMRDGGALQAAFASDPRLAAAFRQHVDPGVNLPSDPQEALRLVMSRGNAAVMSSTIARMPRELQAQLLGRLAGPANDPTLGGLLRELPADPPLRADQVVATVDGAALTGAGAPVSAVANLSIRPADGLARTHRFLTSDPATFRDAVAADLAPYRVLRGDTTQPLTGVGLSNEIGVAMGIPPTQGPRDLEGARQFDMSRDPLFGGPAERAIEPVARAIREVGGEPARVSTLPVFYSNPTLGLQRLPLFRVETSAGASRFVDHQGRVYNDIADYRDNNKLPRGTLLFPETGRMADSTYAPTEIKNSTWDHVQDHADVAVAVLGTAAAGVMLVGSGGLAAPVVAGGASLYFAGRSGSQLYDRARHGESIDPFANSEARLHYLTIGASMLGGAALGVTVRSTAQATVGVLSTASR
ncbi:MAG TPA: DUF4781 domain-containing protein, partial [Myxococcota bacterium]|nr:DUF4781 domain-containing protein [Myxococcota bacterium]